jgi:hypothetical protein
MSCFSARVATANVAEPNPTKHVNYNLGMVLGVDDFTQEFAYLSGRDQWLAGDLIGYGTVRGLKINSEIDRDKGPRITVEPGVAISPRGQLICVPTAQCAYLKDWIEQHSEELSRQSPPPSEVHLYVVLCYRDCPSDNVPIAGEPCRSEDQLVAASRWTDDFSLELRLKAPNQREENAVRDFVKWLKQVDVTDTVASSTPLDQFLDEIRVAAGQWLTSPPASPPSSPPEDFMFGSPPGFIHLRPADVCEYMRAAFRIWVTELRPKWIARWHGCASTHFETDVKAEEDCVMLAELTVPIVAASSQTWTVADHPPVLVDESRRPFVVHARMLQEWMLCGSCCGTATVGPGVGHPAGLPPYQIVAAGIVSNGRAREPVYNGLRVVSVDQGDFRLRFDGYRRPDNTFQYVVKALVVATETTPPICVAFVNFLNDSFVLRVSTTARVAAAVLNSVELMIEVSEASGLRRIEE